MLGKWRGGSLGLNIEDVPGSLTGRRASGDMRAAHTAMFGLAALAFAACGDPKRGEVLVHWTFAGQDCQQAGVHTIQVDIAGEILTPNQFLCINPSNNTMNVGADLGAFFLGTYNLTVTGLDVDGVSVFQSSQSFAVNGDVDVPIDVQALPSTVAKADVSWDALTTQTGGFAPRGFDGAMTCAEAQVDVVRIFVDGVSAGDVACDTNGVEGAVISPLTAGNHSFSISGFRNISSGLLLVYQTAQPVSQPFQIGAITPVDVGADLVGSGIGSASFTWDFTHASAACSGTVTYTLTDPAGVATSQPSSCTSTIQLSNVAAGLWRVTATANSGALHANVVFGVPNQVSPPGPTWTIPFS